MWGRVAALAAALLMGAPGLAAGSANKVISVELCDAAHPGSRIPLPLGRDRDGGPGKACHAGCGVLERRQSPGKSGKQGRRRGDFPGGQF